MEVFGLQTQFHSPLSMNAHLSNHLSKKPNFNNILLLSHLEIMSLYQSICLEVPMTPTQYLLTLYLLSHSFFPSIIESRRFISVWLVKSYLYYCRGSERIIKIIISVLNNGLSKYYNIPPKSLNQD